MIAFAKSTAALALAAATSAIANNASAGPLEDGRLAIIHADQSVLVDDDGRARPADFLKKLGDTGVRVIGRYYGRCRQAGLPNKLLVNGGPTRSSEASAILDGGFAIISFYQYKTSDNTALAKFTSGLPEQHNPDPKQCEQTDYAKTHPVPHSAADEGRLDAQAAVAQAHAVKQPSNTPIYFGMDFSYTKASNPALDKGIIEYFKAIRDELRKPDNSYLIGAYGDGDMLTFLLGLDQRSNGERLIDFAWLSPSRSYPGTPEFTRLGRWHVLQSISDGKVHYTPAGACVDYTYDGDIQNKAAGYEYAGAWNRSGRFVVPAEQTNAIYDQHRYICAPRGINRGAEVASCGNGGATAQVCGGGFCSARVVRVKPQEGAPAGDVAIDVFGYGKFDGRAPATALSPSLAVRPHYSQDLNKNTCD